MKAHFEFYLRAPVLTQVFVALRSPLTDDPRSEKKAVGLWGGGREGEGDCYVHC